MSEINGKAKTIFLVEDLTGEVEVESFDTRADAEKWVLHLMQWRPRARPVIEETTA